MTQDEIIRIFHEAGELAGWRPGVGNPLVINYLAHFAALVAAHEREACAKVCDEVEMRFGRDGDDLEQYGANQCAAAIRART